MTSILSIPRNISIRTKLILAFSLIGISITALVNSMNYLAAKQMLQEEAYNKLVAVREIKKKQLQSFIEEKIQDITTLAHGSDVQILFEQLVQYHTSTDIGFEEAYDVSTLVYQNIVDTYGTLLNEYIEMSGYRNIYLICSAHGHVMYSAFKGDDLGTNLQTGPYRESALARVWSRVVQTGEVVFEDFQPYAPLDGQAVAFIGTPILYSGQLVGVISLQISVEELNAIMLQREGLGNTGETYLVGGDQRLRSDSALDPEHYSVKNLFAGNVGSLNSEAIQRALRGDTGAALIDDYRGLPVLSAYSSLDILGTHWALLAEIKEEEAFANIKKLRDSAFLWGLGFIGLAIIGAILFARGIVSPLQEAAEFATQVSEGNIHIRCEHTSHDEVGQVLLAMQHMIVYLQDVANVAEKISQHDLHVKISPKSEHDTLNHSLIKMVTNLQTMTHDLERSMAATDEQYCAIKAQNWMKDGLSQLGSVLAGNNSLEKCCHTAINTIARYVSAGQGALYLYASDEEALSLQGSFALTERDGLSERYALGESIIGQVAQERKAILLKHADRQERLMHSALISQAPLNTYTLPLVYNDELHGVVELASFQDFGPQELEFLQQASTVIATAIFSAQHRTRNEELLQQAQQAATEAEIAQQEVRKQAQEAIEANARLEEHQQQLQQQNEEFQQLTAQLKGQQQQLLQKSEEQTTLQEKLEQERRLLRKLIDNFPDYIYAKDRQSRFILANRSLAHSVGFASPEELIGKTDLDIHPKALAETFYQNEQTLMRSGQEIRNHEEFVKDSKTREIVWILTSKIPFHDRHGNVMGFVGIGRNVTELKHTEEVLQELEENFEQQLQERSAHLLQRQKELEQRINELESV